jgi:hypothetical protein
MIVQVNAETNDGSHTMTRAAKVRVIDDGTTPSQ